MENLEEQEKKVVALIEQDIASKRKPYIEVIKSQNFSKQKLIEKLADAQLLLDEKNKRNAGRRQSLWRDIAFSLMSEETKRADADLKPAALLKSLEVIRERALTIFQGHITRHNDSQELIGGAKLTQGFIPRELTLPISLTTVAFWKREFENSKKII